LHTRTHSLSLTYTHTHTHIHIHSGNNSAWNQRHFVITNTTGFTSKVLEREIKYVISLSTLSLYCSISLSVSFTSFHCTLSYNVLHSDMCRTLSLPVLLRFASVLCCVRVGVRLFLCLHVGTIEGIVLKRLELWVTTKVCGTTSEGQSVRIDYMFHSFFVFLSNTHALYACHSLSLSLCLSLANTRYTPHTPTHRTHLHTRICNNSLSSQKQLLPAQLRQIEGFCVTLLATQKENAPRFCLALYVHILKRDPPSTDHQSTSVVMRLKLAMSVSFVCDVCVRVSVSLCDICITKKVETSASGVCVCVHVLCVYVLCVFMCG